MSPTVTNGTVRDGITSLTGNMRGGVYNPQVAVSRRRLGVILKFVVAVYFVALAALPFAHHNLVCHLKSSTHCTVCHVGTSAYGTSVQPGLGHVDLAEAGRASEAHASVVPSWVLLPSSGRSPPASTIFLL